MREIELSNDSGRVSLSWSFDGDYYVAVKVRAHGFRGHADGHVADTEFRSFAQAMQDLAIARQGEATLASVLPGLFELSVRSIDRIGHLGVFGSLSFVSAENPEERQSLSFSLHFDPSEVERAAAALREIAA